MRVKPPRVFSDTTEVGDGVYLVEDARGVSATNEVTVGWTPEEIEPEHIKLTVRDSEGVAVALLSREEAEELRQALGAAVAD